MAARARPGTSAGAAGGAGTSAATSAADATRLSHLPPTAVMFAALLGYNPIQMLLGPALTKLPAHSAAYLTGHSFFPSLISGPFQSGLQIAFDFSIAACLIAAVASLLRGKRYVHDELHGEPVLDTTVRAAAGDVTPADIAPVASSTPPALPAGLIEAEAEVGDGALVGNGALSGDRVSSGDRAPVGDGVSAEVAARPRVTVAEEIEAAERRLASPEPAIRYRKER